MSVTFNTTYFVVTNRDKTEKRLWSNVKKFKTESTIPRAYIEMTDGEEIQIVLEDTVYPTLATMVTAIETYIGTHGYNYQVWSALVSQLDTATTSGELVVGKTYVIDTLVVGDDFTNCGYVEEGTAFVAEDTTPTAWTEGTSVFNVTDSEVQANVLENTLGDIVWTTASTGVFEGTLDDAFLEGKTVCVKQNMDVNSDPGSASFLFYRASVNAVHLMTFSDAFTTPASDILENTPIEIRVY